MITEDSARLQRKHANPRQGRLLRGLHRWIDQPSAVVAREALYQKPQPAMRALRCGLVLSSTSCKL